MKLSFLGGNQMQGLFITKIHINKVRHLTNIDIKLSETERRHLILTGRNGSGKTSLLEAVRDFVAYAQNLDDLVFADKSMYLISRHVF
jgi:predicted ATP-binding protein involved in virulence